MPKYIYTAKTEPQKTIHGEIEAETEQEAINKLTRIGYFPISVHSEDLSLAGRGALSFAKVSKKEILQFSRQLSSLSESGINIINSLKIITNQTKNKFFKSVINDVAARIKDGSSLSQALAAHPKLFSNFYTSMVHSGEVGGHLDQTLKRLSDFMERDDEFRSSLASSLIYPGFILAVGTMTIVILVGFVIPRLVSMFEDMMQILPLPTKILISVSDGLRQFWWLILALIISVVFLLRRVYKTSQGKLGFDKLVLKLPVWGQIALKTEISRFSKTLSLLIASGIPMVTGLEVAASVTENSIMKQEIQKFKTQITEGASFSKCLSSSTLFPEFVTNLISVGEEGGTLEKSLGRISDSYEKDVDRDLKTLSRMSEPVMILVMGLIVGFIVLSMLLPIFQINMMVR